MFRQKEREKRKIAYELELGLERNKDKIGKRLMHSK